MVSTEQRIEELEVLIEQLSEQVRKNHVILNGDPDVSFSSGVLTRLNRIESHFAEQAKLIQELTKQIARQNEQREREQDIRQAREEERDKIFISLEKWIKILGPLIGGGLGFQILFEVFKTLNGG